MTNKPKCLECNNVLEQHQPGDKPFCNKECETRFDMLELTTPSNMWQCLNCNGPLGYEPEMCCNGHECGCRGWPIDPPFCSSECETNFTEKCQSCDGDGMVMMIDNGLPAQDKCRECDGSGRRPWIELCQVCGDEVKVTQEYEITTCGKPKCHDSIIGRWGI